MIRLEDCSLDDNVVDDAGGAVLVRRGSGAVTRSTFARSTAAGRGSAVAVDGGKLVFDTVTFANNGLPARIMRRRRQQQDAPPQGRALWVGADVSLLSCGFQDNSWGAVAVSGSGRLGASNCSFNGNYVPKAVRTADANATGGALLMLGGAAVKKNKIVD